MKSEWKKVCGLRAMLSHTADIFYAAARGEFKVRLYSDDDDRFFDETFKSAQTYLRTPGPVGIGSQDMDMIADTIEKLALKL